MALMNGLDGLRSYGRVSWDGRERGWVGDPDEIVAAFAREGFREYRREEVRSGRGRRVAGGFWQGLHDRHGVVASAIWVRHPDGVSALVFISLDGEPVTDDARH